MTKETIQELLKELKELESKRNSINSKIFELKEKLLPPTFKIETEWIDLEHLGGYDNYWFISREYKTIGKNWQSEIEAILDAWNNYREICNKR